MKFANFEELAPENTAVAESGCKGKCGISLRSMLCEGFCL